ncbi:MAG: radical SAM protein [Acidobacteria bacterium]|nr:radical SAM protein [Acidobacteriota bacterium]
MQEFDIKILLGLLPFWTPWIPPTGIAQLKHFLQGYGYKVKTVDATVEKNFKALYHKYFNRLKQYIPENKQGNFYNIGHDLLQNHMMAHFQHEDESAYLELVRILIYKIYYCEFEKDQIQEFNSIIQEFYHRLEKYLLDLLKIEQPDVFGLTVYCHNLPASLFAFKLCREKYPHIKTLMGGGIFVEQLSTGSPNWELFLQKTPYLDRIIIGQGEKIFLKFLQGQLEPGKRVFTLEDIGEKPIPASNLELPDFTDFNLEYYSGLGAFGSISCPFQCRFCSQTLYFGEYQKKDPKQTVKEIMELHNHYHTRYFSMTDSLLNPIIFELANEFIKMPTSLYWEGGLRVGESVCDAEQTFHWRRGGFYKAIIGIESGSQHVLDLIGKKITVQQSKDSLFNLASAGIKTTTYWIVGFPGETEADFQKTLDFIEEVKDYIYEAECHPFQYLTDQVNREDWAKKSVLLYPAEAKELLIVQTWIVNCEPPREEIYRRLNRFIMHCKKLGIPNPYSAMDIYQADLRWKELHPNAVPTLVDITSNKEPFPLRNA